MPRYIMINYEYMTYWLQTMENLRLLKELLLSNVNNYIRTQDIEHLECAIECIKEIQRLTPLKQSYYDKMFNNP